MLLTGKTVCLVLTLEKSELQRLSSKQPASRLTYASLVKILATELP